MIINTNYTGTYAATVGAVAKLVRQYIESGELRDRFEAFDKDAVEFGDSFEVNLILAAEKQASKAAEHGQYDPNALSLIFSTKVAGQYAVTINEQKIRECVGDAAKQAEYAAELTQSLYQGWTRDKNAAVAAAASALISGAGSKDTVTKGDDTAKYATDILTAIKTWVENLREGVTGTSYGNTNVGGEYVASRSVVIVMSNALAALLDTNGFAKTLSPEYMQTAGVVRITSNKIAENTVLVTDSRNIQVRRKYEKLVGPIENSDGSYNMFYNKEEFVETAKTSSGIVAFPYIVVTTEEA